MSQTEFQGFRLSPQQRRLWSLQQRETGMPYRVRVSVRVEGEVDPEVLKEALHQTILRHEVLRTTFRRLPGVEFPVQVINDDPSYEFALYDFSHLAAADAEASIERLWQESETLVFDLAHGPLLHVSLIALSRTEGQLQLCLPALCTDEAGLVALVRELARAYEAIHDDGSPLQYADISEVLNDLLESEETAAGRAYWLKPGFGTTESKSAFDDYADRERAFSPRTLNFTLAPGVVERTSELARAYGVSPAILLEACWHVLLSRMTGQEEITVSAAFSGRVYEGLDEVPGLFARYLPISSVQQKDQQLSDVLGQIRQAVTEANEQQDYFDYERVAQLNSVRREQPFFFPLAFEFIESSSPVQVSSLKWTIHLQTGCTDRFRIKLRCVTNASESLRTEFQYDAARVDVKTVERLALSFRTLLSNILQQPNVALSELEILADEQRREILVEFNQTATTFPSPHCIHEAIEQQSTRTPHGVAVRFGQEALTYSELDDRANQLARHLRQKGAGPETLVAILCERSLEMMVGLLGILKAGAAYLPLDPEQPPERLKRTIEDGQAKLLLTHERFLTLTTAIGSPSLDVVCLDKDWPTIAIEPTLPITSGAGPGNVAYVIYTSGSTGQPKGVAITHEAICNRLLWMQQEFPLSTADRVLQKTVYSFDASVWELFLPLMAGASVVLAAPGAHRDSAALVTALKEHEVTVLQMVPSMLAVLVEERGIGECRSLQRVFSGGEALTESLQERFYERVSWAQLINLYGPTEVSIDASYHVCERGRKRNKVLIGRPISNMQLYLLDKRQQPAPVGTAGELYVGGVGLARGYWQQASLTAERFVPHGFSDARGARLYRTGDIARYLSDGTVEYLGRVDHQVKVRGVRIELGEIETALSQHPAVRQNVVIVREDVPGEKRLVAYVVPAETVVPTAAEWRRALKEKLPDYMIPAAFEILDALPLTANGKLDQKRLPPPTQLTTGSQRSYVAPRTPLEETLANIWAQVLKLDQVGIHDNFFELGGDSIRSIQVKAAAQKVGVEFSLEELFAHQSVYTLAQELKAAEPIALLPTRTEPFSLIGAEDRARMPEDVEDAYPLTALQSGMFFHREYTPDTAIYHDITTFHLRGEVDLPILEQAIEQLAARHPILRTSFDLTSFSEPLQLVYQTADIPLETIDLRSLSEAEQKQALEDWIETQRMRVFDYSRPPLLRFTVHRRSDETIQFTMNCHHAILDGWSVGVMMSELLQFYFFALGKAEPLSAPPSATFRDFVALERSALNSQVVADYWMQKLSDHAVLTLPRWREPTEQTADLPLLHEVRLTNDLSEGLRRLARMAGVPMKSVLLAAHLRVMGLIGGLTDVLTGVVTNCRLEEADGDRAVGLFLNTLPFRQQLTGGEWIDLVRQTFAAEREMLPHRWFPLAEMQRRAGGGHLFETAFNFIHFHVYESVSGFAEMQALSAVTFEQTNHALTASFSIEVPSLQVNFALLCDAAQLDQEQVETITGYYLKTLEAMAHEPRGRYESVMLLSDREQQQLLLDWNETSGDYELDHCLHERIEAQVEKTPDAVAVVYAGESLTYRQLDARANQLAGRLHALGVGPEVMVGVVMERSLEMMVGLLAILKAGGTYVPLDPEQPSERFSLILDDAKPRVLLTQQRFEALVQGHGIEVLSLDRESFNAESTDRVNSDVAPGNVAYVIYTSGSTGQPKGVAITHEAICNRLLWMQQEFPLSTADRVLQKTVYSFDASVWELFLPLMAGASVVLAGPGAHRDSAALVTALKEHEVTVLQMVPSMLAVLVEERGIGECRSLQRVFSGGEALTESLQERFYERASWAQLINLYGPTEVSIDASYHVCERGRKRNKVIIGRPISNMQLYLLDERQQPAPVGTAGELYIGGVGLARGYCQQASLTAERFVPHGFSDARGARLYRTGDIARYLSDGTVEYLGRVDHQVKVRGVRIELGEIKAALLGQPGVRDAAVVARDDSSNGKHLIAYVVSANHGEAGTSPEELRRALRVKLPDYMVPQAFVLLDELPKLANGKLNLRALPAPGESRDDERQDYVAPLTPVEDIVADIWANALRVERVGRDDNFFELGGHSLSATQVVSRIRQVFQIELPLRTLFDEPVVHALSRSIELARGLVAKSLAEPIQPVSRDSVLPLSFAQKRMWFLNQLEPEAAAYNVASAIRLEGALHLDALQQSLDVILARHEALRTTFTTLNGEAIQLIQPPQPASLQVADLRGLSDTEGPAELRRLMDQEVKSPFDLSRGPLLRVLLLQLRPHEHVMLLTMHHIVSDGWSLGVFVRELSALYEAFSRGEALELPELPIQYADFAVWQHDWLQGDVLDAQLNYWRRQLADAPAVVEIPTDHPRPAVQTSRGANHYLQIDSNTSKALLALSRREAVSLFMTMVAAFQLLVKRHSGLDHVVIGTDVANRNRQELEGLIGFFANQLVLHTDLSGNPTFRELLTRVREVTLGAYAHQDLPFEKLVEELHPERDLSRTPLFQLKIVMQNAPLPVVDVEGLRLFPEELGGGTAKFDVTLFLEDTPQGLNCTWQYNSDLFTARTIRQLAASFERILEQVAREPNARLDQLIATLDEIEKEERSSEKKKLAAANLEKFKLVKSKSPITDNEVALSTQRAP